MKLISFDRYLNNLWSSVDYLKNDIYDLQKLLHFECDLVPNAHHTKITNDLLLVVICTAFDEFVFLRNFWIRPIDRRHNINDFNWINFELLVFIISETLKMNESIMFNALSLQLIEKTLVRRGIKRRWWKKIQCVAALVIQIKRCYSQPNSIRFLPKLYHSHDYGNELSINDMRNLSGNTFYCNDVLVFFFVSICMNICSLITLQ